MNYSYYVGSPWVYVCLAAISAVCVAAMRYSWRWRESRRKMTRYEFNEHGVRAVPPIYPHSKCSALVCFQSKDQRGCTRGKRL